MKPTLITAVMATAIVLILVPDIAAAQAGRMHRATRRRTAVVVHSATQAQDQQAAAAQQEAAAPEEQPAEAQQPAAQEPVAPPPAGQPLPMGTVVSALPAGCVATTDGDVEYYHCGSDYYRSAFQGNTLVYVTTEPPQTEPSQ